MFQIRFRVEAFQAQGPKREFVYMQMAMRADPRNRSCRLRRQFRRSGKRQQAVKQTLSALPELSTISSRFNRSAER